MKPNTRKRAHTSLKQIAGQVTGLQQMVEESRYCVDVLLEIAAIREALDQVGRFVLGSHVETCLGGLIRPGAPSGAEQPRAAARPKGGRGPGGGAGGSSSKGSPRTR